MLLFYYLKNLKGLICFIRLFILFILFFYFLIGFAFNLSINNNNLYCDGDNCKLLLRNNQSLISNVSNKFNVFELLEENKSLGYYFYTTDIVDRPAYSGKPLDVLILLDKNCFIKELKLIKHSEPILMTGIPVEKLLEAVCFYKGKNIRDDISIGDDKSGKLSVPIIAGATVTSFVLHNTILDSSREIAISFGLMTGGMLSGKKLNNVFKVINWDDLLKINAIGRLKVFSNDIFYNKDKENKLFIDIYFMDTSHPSIGINILGKEEYINLLDNLKENEKNSAILILNNGDWSFKGNAFVRGGLFDRFSIKQGFKTVSFRDTDYIPLYDLDSVSVDDFKEHGIFIISDKEYNLADGFEFSILVSYITNNINYKHFSVNYELSDLFYDSIEKPWVIAWKSKLYYIILYVLLWLFVIFIFIIKYRFSNHKKFLSNIYICVLLLSVYIIGILQAGQPSIVNVFTIFNDYKNIFNVFILDAYIFLGWVMILLTVLLWGRSLFCGWICPFGALQELLFVFRGFFYKKGVTIELPEIIRNKLKHTRYLILFILLCISFYKMEYAELYAEIEPFKTMWNVVFFSREWYYSLYCFFLLFLSLFTYRIFCRFLCPLGAFLSVLSIFQIFKLARRNACSKCRICKNTCNSFAINRDGKINNLECYACFTCINNMNDNKICPPLISKKVRDRYANI